MRRTFIPVVTVALMCFAAAPAANAQKKVVPFLGAGMIMPSGAFGTYTNNGWLVYGGLDWHLMTPGLAVGVSVIYGNVGHNDEKGASTSIPGVFGDMVYVLAATSPSRVKVYLRGGVGVIQLKDNPGEFGYPSESETKTAINTGAGLEFMQKAMTLLFGLHMINASGTSLLLIHGGVALSGSGGAAKLR